MNKKTIHIEWQGDMKFETELDGHKLIIDAAPEVGGTDKGPRPKPLMLVALAGCTGMDVVSILKKMRVELEGLKVWVEAEQTDEHPKHYSSMKVIYEFKGKNLPMDKLEKAVSLSEERYCGVSAVYKKAIPVTNEIRVVE
ncbi:MAG TPA: OsmC family protein [Tenuifilaceae bacterium]|nr:OsmC family protein [Tenuifilaceae bacterium]HPE19637.1 OsmC family protein [Tenuifilaceae bacterium]HPJ44861.1 OsmC family protein [Tenuifilaceae bacterium]HPQ33172.1 OsmC family protein [Tenuifilaceae bacterium]